MRFFKRKELLPKEHQERIIKAIQDAEKETSGEIRVFVESRCKYVHAIERAHSLFFRLKMDQTKLRNGVIIYVALKDRQSAILGDKGIYEMTRGPQFWQDTLNRMNNHFKDEKIAEGIAFAIAEIGAKLSHHFPYDAATDKNELPDNIVFGR